MMRDLSYSNLFSKSSSYFKIPRASDSLRLEERNVMQIGSNLKELNRKNSKSRNKINSARGDYRSQLKPEEIVEDFETDAHFDHGLEVFLRMPLTERKGKPKFLARRRKSAIRFRDKPHNKRTNEKKKSSLRVLSKSHLMNKSD